MRVLVSAEVGDLDQRLAIDGVANDQALARQLAEHRVAVGVFPREQMTGNATRLVFDSPHPIGQCPQAGKAEPGDMRAARKLLVVEKPGGDETHSGHKVPSG
jgi:hypothetical protein